MRNLKLLQIIIHPKTKEIRYIIKVEPVSIDGILKTNYTLDDGWELSSDKMDNWRTIRSADFEKPKLVNQQSKAKMFQLFNTYPYNTKKYKRFQKHFQKFRKQEPYNIKKVKKYLRLLNRMSVSNAVISLRTQFVYSEILRENMKPFLNNVFEEWLESEKIKKLI